MAGTRSGHRQRARSDKGGAARPRTDSCSGCRKPGADGTLASGQASRQSRELSRLAFCARRGELLRIRGARKAAPERLWERGGNLDGVATQFAPSSPTGLGYAFDLEWTQASPSWCRKLARDFFLRINCTASTWRQPVLFARANRQYPSATRDARACPAQRFSGRHRTPAADSQAACALHFCLRTLIPLSRALPVSASCGVAMVRMSVLLPAPLGPSKPYIP